MYKDHRIAVVVPAHNEVDHIGDVIDHMPALVDHIVVIDDFSSDGTAERAAAAGDPRVVIIRHELNRGVGGAILSGHRRVLELGDDVSVVMAGDDQMDPAHLESLLEPICERGYGFAKANRFYSAKSYSGMPRHRVLGNVLLSFLTKAASGYWHLFDPQNGYTAISRQALERLDLDAISEGYEFENDLLVSLNILDVRATDVPIPARYGNEVSGIRLRRVVPALSLLLFRSFWRRIMWKYVLRSFSPVALMLFAGMALCALGLLVGAWVLYESLGPPVAPTATVLLAVAPILVGVQFLISALVLDIGNSPD